MSLELYGSKDKTLLALVNNLKLSIAAIVYDPKLVVKLPEDDDHIGVLLKDKKTGFELFEPNAIVKYLAKNYTTDEHIKIEEKELHQALLTNKKENLEQVKITTPSKVELNPSQIILFSSLYPIYINGTNAWFNEFAEKVVKGVQHALSITKVERVKEQNTGAQNYIKDFWSKTKQKELFRNRMNVTSWLLQHYHMSITSLTWVIS